MNLTHKREHLPTTEPITGPERDAAAAAAAAEYNECRKLLSKPSAALTSPRMRRRYTEALAWHKLYTE